MILDDKIFSDEALSGALSSIFREHNTSWPENPALAMAYVPIQVYKSCYEPIDGYSVGTVFPELNKPFTAGDKK